MPRSEENPHSDLKLPTGPSARRRRAVKDEAWSDIDKAERRRPIAAIVVIAILLIAGIALIVSGLG